MVDSDGRTDNGARARRKRAFETGGRIFLLFIGLMYLVAFGLAVRTGYLTWIGVLVGVLFVLPSVISPILSLAGRKRLSTVLTWGGAGIPVLAALVWQVSVLRTEQDSRGWMPYQFDRELAAVEARRAVPDAENAAHCYESTFALMDVNGQPTFAFSGNALRDEIGKHPWKSDDHPQASEWLDSYAKVIDELLAIGEMEKCRWPVQADTYDEYTVSYEKLRRCVLLLIAVGNRDLGEGHVTEAVAKYLCAVRISDHVRQQPSTVDSVTGFACEGIGLERIRRVLVQSDLSDEDIARIAGRLPPTVDPWPEEWARLREFEKLHYMNLVGRIYEVDREGEVRLANLVISPEDEPRSWFPRVYWFLSMPRDPHKMSEIAERHFAQIDRDINLGRLTQGISLEYAAHLSLTDIVKAMCNTYRWGVEMAFFNAPEYMRHQRRCIPCITVRRGTWLVLGLRRYHASHGMWPNALDEISQYVPRDTFSDPTTGGAFAYTPEGDSFRLHSRGFNRIDEGGRNGYSRDLDRNEDDIVIWPPPPAREPEPCDKESDMGELEKISGKDYVQMLERSDPNDKR